VKVLLKNNQNDKAIPFKNISLQPKNNLSMKSRSRSVL